VTSHRGRVLVARLAIVVLCAPVASVAAQHTTLITDGIAALSHRDVHSAVRLFTEAATDSSGSVASAAERWLAHVAWKVNGDARSATTHLDRALNDGGDTTLILLERARVAAFTHRFGDAVRFASEATKAPTDDEGHGLAARALVELSVDAAFAAMTSGHRVSDSLRAEPIAEASYMLMTRVSRFAGRSADALALIDAGALLGDTTTVRAGWAFYFLLAGDSTAAALRRIEGANHGRGVAALLAESRLYEPAAVLLEVERERIGRETNALARDTRLYGSFIHDMGSIADDVYRRELTGVAREGDLERAMNARTRTLWSALHWSGAPPPYYPAAVPIELAKRFGAIISTDADGGIHQLRLSHVLASFITRDVRRRLTPRYVILDGVVANGVDPWLVDGGSGRAGWVAGDSIYEIRTAFTEQPFREWIALTDRHASAMEQARVARESVADLDRSRRDSIGYLPGVASRIFHDGARVIVDSLARTGLTLNQQQSAFVTLVFRHLTHTTIDLHEMRHFIDSHTFDGRLSIEDAEFRAKIDEVSGATRPKLALTAILHPNIGDATPHGRANRRIMIGLIRWMRANATHIAGFDATLPPLIQLPSLSDAQLRAAFESMRPAR
jgi:hypothetical protein